MGRLLKPHGERIRALRLGKGWYREQLAQIAGVGIGTIRRVEAGNTVSFEALRAIACAFGLEVHDLMRGLPADRNHGGTGRLFKLMATEAVAATVAWCMPYAPAAKGLMATFAMIVLAASAIALSPLLVERDEDSIIVASSQSLSPVPTPVLTKTIEASAELQAPRPAGSRASAPRLARPENAMQSGLKEAPSTEVPVSPRIPARGEPPQTEHGSPSAPLHASQPAGAVQAIVGVIHTDWLRKLAQPVAAPGDYFRQTHFREGTTNRGGGGGYSILGKPFVRSGKTTAAFFAKVGTSIKRAF